MKINGINDKLAELEGVLLLRNESKREGIQNFRLNNETLSKGEKEIRMLS